MSIDDIGRSKPRAFLGTAGRWNTIAANLLRRGFMRVMLEKLGRRIRPGRGNKDENVAAWLQKHASSYEEYLEEFDTSHKRDFEHFKNRFTSHADRVLSNVPFDLGGAGLSKLLFLLVRKRKPRVVVETGVAAGHSSAAILEALELNGEGELFSSDFPYFRVEKPEQYVGIVVEPERRQRWALHIEGDSQNLPRIVTDIKDRGLNGIDLFHYDSDKTYAGRRWATKFVQRNLNPDSVFLMDDISDNEFFLTLVTRCELPYRVFLEKGKRVGLIEGSALRSADLNKV